MTATAPRRQRRGEGALHIVGSRRWLEIASRLAVAGPAEDIFLKLSRKKLGKRQRVRRVSAGVGFRSALSGVLPINGQQRKVPIDTGCTDNIIFSGRCRGSRSRDVAVHSISGDPFYVVL